MSLEPKILLSGSYNAFSEGYNGCGIYAISGLVPSSFFEIPIYIGSAINKRDRIKVHKHKIDSRTHPNNPLKNYIYKYGWENIVIWSLEEVMPCDLLEAEQKYINFYGTAEDSKAFNICPIAGSSLGKLASQQTKLKLSKAKKGERNSFWGKTHSQETKDKISKANSRPCSEEAKEKIRQVHLKNLANELSVGFSVKSPDGEVFEGKNISKFCRERGLARTGISKVNLGKWKQYKGWTKA